MQQDYYVACTKINKGEWKTADAMSHFPELKRKTLLHKLRMGTYESSLNETKKRGLGPMDRVAAFFVAGLCRRGFPMAPAQCRSYLYRIAVALKWEPKNPDMKQFYVDWKRRHSDILRPVLSKNLQMHEPAFNFMLQDRCNRPMDREKSGVPPGAHRVLR